MARIPNNPHWDGECQVEFVQSGGIYNGQLQFTAEYEFEITNKGDEREYRFSYNLEAQVLNEENGEWVTTGDTNPGSATDTLATDVTVTQETYNPPHPKNLFDHRHLIINVANGRKYRAVAYVTLQAFKNQGEDDNDFPLNIRTVKHTLFSQEVQA